MSLKVSGFSSAALDYKIIYFDNQNTPTAAIQENVTGTSGRWYSVDVDNKSGSAVYVRLYDGYGPVLGTSASHWGFRVEATTSNRFEIPSGAPFAALNVWTTSGDDPKDSSPPASSGVTVTVLTS
tara:strand:- start:2131 stop:2505 length:375 start_codon:yes stop_codon:yes gene_type:complete